MSRAVRFLVFLILGLAGLTLAAAVLVQAQTRSWFEKDINLRARLAVNGSREKLVRAWPSDRATLAAILTEVTQDERIMGACACSRDGRTLARTRDYPPELDCSWLVERIAKEGLDSDWGHWTSEESLPGGEVHLAALPVSDERGGLGYVVLEHDLSFVARRDTKMRLFLLIAFGVLSVSASVLTIVASRVSWRHWSEELRRFLRVGGQHKEFQPILADVRELADRLMEHEGRAWTPVRLRETLRHHLDGERIVVLANREPYMHQRSSTGTVEVMHPASGMVTALEPILRACSGTWIAHGSGSADRETVDRSGGLRVPPVEETRAIQASDTYRLRRVWLSPEEEQGYYYGFSNEGLWPLCHIAHTRPVFRSRDWREYCSVNEKFVRAVLEEVDSEDPVVLVQDYHFALAPALLRERLPRATVIMFWHVPWPNSEIFGICPYRNQLLEGMLGASILGFHTQFHCNNFMDSVDRFLEARVDRDRNAVVHHGRETLVHPYPISVEWPMRQLADVPNVKSARSVVRTELGIGEHVRLGVGVDRNDYTKGILERFLAVERLFERHPEYIGTFTFVQLGAPSRTSIGRYQELNAEIERLAERIDKRFARPSWRPLILRRAHHEPPTVFLHLRAADVCYVSSLHDGMNLVAKEFVAARDDEQGVLVLSQFTGAARELTEALIVNPYNIDEGADALAAALEMKPSEQAARMRSMRSYLSEFNVYGWAGKMLLDASRLRRRDSLHHVLSKESVRAGSATT